MCHDGTVRDHQHHRKQDCYHQQDYLNPAAFHIISFSVFSPFRAFVIRDPVSLQFLLPSLFLQLLCLQFLRRLWRADVKRFVCLL